MNDFDKDNIDNLSDTQNNILNPFTSKDKYQS